MSKILNEIKKSKSFDKRYRLVEENIEGLSEQEKSEIAILLAESAKNSKHHGLIVFLLGRPEMGLDDSAIKEMAYKIDDIPEDAGGAMLVMHCRGMHEDVKAFFCHMLDNVNFNHPNIKVQFAVFGTLIPYLKSQATEIVEGLKSQNPDWPDFLINVPPYGSIPYLTYWLDTMEIS